MVLGKIKVLRKEYHVRICNELLAKKNGTVNIADVSSPASKQIALELADILGGANCTSPPSGQEAGRVFTEITLEFLKKAFDVLKYLRPGEWEFRLDNTHISNFDQYKHLSIINELARDNKVLASSLGTDYLVKPDEVHQAGEKRPTGNGEEDRVGVIL